MDKKENKLSKENPEKISRGQRADWGDDDDDDENGSWVIVTNEPCPLCGAKLSAHGSVSGIDYLFCTNYPCKYVD